MSPDLPCTLQLFAVCVLDVLLERFLQHLLHTRSMVSISCFPFWLDEIGLPDGLAQIVPSMICLPVLDSI
jgi:hypothetical protein